MAWPNPYVPFLTPIMFWWVGVERALGIGPHEKLMRTIEKDTRELEEKWAREHPDETRSRAESGDER